MKLLLYLVGLFLVLNGLVRGIFLLINNNGISREIYEDNLPDIHGYYMLFFTYIISVICYFLYQKIYSNEKDIQG